MHIDEHGNYNPQCPICGARECEAHLLLDVEPGEAVGIRTLLDEQSTLVSRIGSEMSRIASIDSDIDVEGSDALLELIDASICAVEVSDELALNEFESEIALYLIETARAIPAFVVEDHAFEGDSPVSDSAFLRLYAKDRSSAVHSLAAAVERDLALLSHMQ